MKILVLAGGLSPERDVSITTGSLVADALVSRGHLVCLCDLYTGLTFDGRQPAFSRERVPACLVKRSEPDLEALKKSSGRGDRRVGPGIMELCREADVVFIGLHGDVGENGMLQAALDMDGVPYTGSDYIGSLLAMDKDLSKQLFVRAGVQTPPWIRVDLPGGSADDAVGRIEAAIGYPCVIKPVACGSSVGVSMPEGREELKAALTYASAYGQTVLAEKKIEGRELTVSVLGGRVLPSVEIIPVKGFYNYENKYQKGAATEVCPAPITDGQRLRLEEAALRGFAALRLRGYARFDFIMDAAGEMWCLEANTLPGMTPTSLLPQEAAAVGMDYPSLCEEIIRLALAK